MFLFPFPLIAISKLLCSNQKRPATHVGLAISVSLNKFYSRPFDIKFTRVYDKNSTHNNNKAFDDVCFIRWVCFVRACACTLICVSFFYCFLSYSHDVAVFYPTLCSSSQFFFRNRIHLYSYHFLFYFHLYAHM